MKSYISFTSLRLPLLFPFLAPLFIFSRSFIIVRMEGPRFQPSKHGFIICIFMFIGESLIGIFEAISVYRQRKEQNNDKERQTIMLFPTYQGEDRIQKDWTLLMLFLMALLDYGVTTGLLFLPSLSSYLMAVTLEPELKVIQILFTALFGFFILKVPMYRHQYLSCGLILVGIILILREDIDIIAYVPYYLIFYAVSSAQEVIEKWVMYYKYVSPFRLLCIEGLFGLGISLIGLFIVSYIPCHWNFCYLNNRGKTIDSFNEGFKDLFSDEMNILFIFGYILCSIGLNVCTSLTSFYFTATHRTISDNLTSFVWGMYYIVERRVFLYLSYLIPGYLIIFFGCLMYNEIVIIKCCKLHEYTVDEISQRAKIDRDKSISEGIINRANFNVIDPEQGQEEEQEDQEVVMGS